MKTDKKQQNTQLLINIVYDIAFKCSKRFGHADILISVQFPLDFPRITNFTPRNSILNTYLRNIVIEIDQCPTDFYYELVLTFFLLNNRVPYFFKLPLEFQSSVYRLWGRNWKNTSLNLFLSIYPLPFFLFLVSFVFIYLFFSSSLFFF